MSRPRLLALLGLSALLSAGCASVVDPFALLAGELSSMATGEAVAGARICARGVMADCATAGPDGVFEIDLPRHREVWLEVTREGYPRVLAGVDTDSLEATDPYWLWAVPDDTLVTAMLEAVGRSWQAGRGLVHVVIEGPGGTPGEPRAGLVLELSGPGELYYAGPSAYPSRDYAETSSAGAAFAVNVPPGEYTVSVGGVSGCTARRGLLAASKTTAAVVRVEADTLTSVSLVCD